ncbi:cysteine desulfurase, partial [Haematococcus lacustris]
MPQLGEPLLQLRSCVYMDYNGTTPIWPQVAEAMLPFLTDHFGNPSSGHVYGQKCKAAVELARQQGQASFTAVGVDAEGLVDPEAVLAAVTRDTVLVSIMHSNNEVGSLQPIAAISAGLRKAGPQVLLHTDAAQSLGKVAVDVEALGVDLLTLVGHKLGAPKGVAALWVGLGKAAEIARLEGAATARHMQTMRDYMQQRLVAAFPEGRVRVNGPSGPDLRLPNTLSISIAGLSAAAALVALADKLAASAGAACHSSGASLSSVLRAMGVDPTFGAVWW